MTLDELDAAFDAGVINETTLVLHCTAPAWTTLGHLAGIDPAPKSAGPTAFAVAHDVIDDELTDPMVMEFRSRKRGVVLGIGAALMILGGLAFAVTRFGGDGARASASSSAAGVHSPSVDSAAAVPAPPPPANVEPAKPALTDRTEERAHGSGQASRGAAKAEAKVTAGISPPAREDEQPVSHGRQRARPSQQRPVTFDGCAVRSFSGTSRGRRKPENGSPMDRPRAWGGAWIARTRKTAGNWPRPSQRDAKSSQSRM